MKGGRKSERLREREIDQERGDRSEWRTAAARLGGFGGGVEWAGDRWRSDQRLVVAAKSTSALESLVEYGLRSVVKIGIELGALGDEISGSI